MAHPPHRTNPGRHGLHHRRAARDCCSKSRSSVPAQLLGKVADGHGPASTRSSWPRRWPSSWRMQVDRRSADIDDPARRAQRWSPRRWPRCTASCRSSSTATRSRSPCASRRTCAIQDELRTFLGYDIRGVVAGETDVNEGDRSATTPRATKASRASSTTWRTIAELKQPRPRHQSRQGRSTWPMSRSWPRARRSASCSTWCCCWRSRTRPPTSTSSRSRTSSRCASGPTACSTRWCRRRGTWPSPSPRRIKVMANLDIAERRLPQDGRIELTVGGNPVDLRVSVLPTMFGESVVMRVLDRTVVVARPGQGRHGRGDAQAVPRGHRQAQRHRPGDRARPARARRPRSTRRSAS